MSLRSQLAFTKVGNDEMAGSANGTLRHDSER